MADVARSDRSLVLIGLGVLALVVIAALAVVLLGDRGDAALEPGSPEAVVQQYVNAYEARDYEAAHAFFSEEVRDEMPLDEYERLARDFSPGGDVSRRVLFDETTVDGSRARVELTVEEFYGGGGPFGGGDTFRSTREIRLIREDGGWRIDEPLVGLDQGPVPMSPGG